MEVFEAVLRDMRAGCKAALLTVISATGSAPRHAGARMLVREDGSSVGTIGGGAVEHRAMQEARKAIEEGRTVRFAWDLGKDLGMVCGGSMEIFIEPLIRPRRFHVFGAGHVSVPTTAILRSLGFHVVVIDHRNDLAREERFPGCEVRCEDPIAFLDTHESTPDGWYLLISHSHMIDEQLLEHLARRPWAYLGLIGSRSKVARFLLHLRKEGVPQAILDNISAPVGLDIGAETPEEIAVAIAAEVVCQLRAHTGAVDRMRVPRCQSSEDAVPRSQQKPCPEAS